MNLFVGRYWWGSLSDRRCDLTLALQDVAFADFDLDNEGQLSLLRISFDGFGCCTPERRDVIPMSRADSALLLEHVADENLGADEVSEVLVRYFEQHRSVIWEDELIAHELVQIEPKRHR